MTKKTIVVGAGILGASTAYHLAKKGADVLLVDRKDIGQATEAGAGIVCPWLTQRRNKPWYRLVKGGASYYPTLIKELEDMGEQQTGYAQVGAINIYDTEEKLEKKMKIAKERKELAPEMGEIKILNEEETRAMFPPLVEGYGAIYISGGARVNGRELRDALIRGAEKHGAEMLYGDASLVYEGSTVTGVTVEGETFDSDSVIVTGGAWSQQLLEPLGMTFKVTHQKAQIVHLDLPDTDTSKWPVLMPPYNQYMLTFGGGRVVVGATHEDDPDYDSRVTMGGVHDILHKAIAIAPGLRESTFVETKVGFRPFTPGFLPIAGAVPHMAGLYVANGLGASGLTSGPYLGAELARHVLGEETELDLSDYDVTTAFE
ncbi:oxidoreductase [Pontibacillus halophilus JSM 076056 = DSM 19796]|uniref:Oxidoreductase n=1 Tax=Pontibacillus halophilus JSM 076056 = DSM 19796 TaxID=1385510 RepID=A0A0A5GFD8_9BACI|nr:FAD-dependent oxidoreductase [Pontibacillus halophilus]KGX91931.1 oxidoreductase [Pontibacillus halophilus JSM 076056 = DSM 19796]